MSFECRAYDYYFLAFFAGLFFAVLLAAFTAVATGAFLPVVGFGAAFTATGLAVFLAAGLDNSEVVALLFFGAFFTLVFAFPLGFGADLLAVFAGAAFLAPFPFGLLTDGAPPKIDSQPSAYVALLPTRVIVMS